MDAIVRLQSRCSYATLSASLTLTKGRRVALVFPVDARTCLNDTALLSALSSRCQQLGKSVVLIGGDAWLRAHAVAAGFETATTLEDWGETAPNLPATAARQPSTDGRRLWLVTPPLANTYATGEHDAWVSEPPDYVVALRQVVGGIPLAVHAPVVRPSGALYALADDRADDPIAASERFEEAMIGRILETSGIHRAQIPGRF
jgi:hypothetical protein